MDPHSDLDLVIAVRPEAWTRVAGRTELARGAGRLLASFTGEHVGEPRLLICLYGPPLLHVDLKFVCLPDMKERIEDPVILWDRDGSLQEAMAEAEPRYPEPDLQWIEDRFWIWAHYGAVKIARGELFEALGFLSFLRGHVLGPLLLLEAGALPSGVRRIETHAPGRVSALAQTLGAHDATACSAALLAAIDLYAELRSSLASPELNLRVEAERESRRFAEALLTRDQKA